MIVIDVARPRSTGVIPLNSHYDDLEDDGKCPDFPHANRDRHPPGIQQSALEDVGDQEDLHDEEPCSSVEECGVGRVVDEGVQAPGDELVSLEHGKLEREELSGRIVAYLSHRGTDDEQDKAEEEEG